LTNSGFDIQYYIPTCELHLFFKIDVQHVCFVKVGGHVVAGKETVKYIQSRKNSQRLSLTLTLCQLKKDQVALFSPSVASLAKTCMSICLIPDDVF